MIIFLMTYFNPSLSLGKELIHRCSVLARSSLISNWIGGIQASGMCKIAENKDHDRTIHNPIYFNGLLMVISCFRNSFTDLRQCNKQFHWKVLLNRRNYIGHIFGYHSNIT